LIATDIVKIKVYPPSSLPLPKKKREKEMKRKKGEKMSIKKKKKKNVSSFFDAVARNRNLDPLVLASWYDLIATRKVKKKGGNTKKKKERPQVFRRSGAKSELGPSPLRVGMT
jgi:hypothetical protein